MSVELREAEDKLDVLRAEKLAVEKHLSESAVASDNDVCNAQARELLGETPAALQSVDEYKSWAKQLTVINTAIDMQFAEVKRLRGRNAEHIRKQYEPQRKQLAGKARDLLEQFAEVVLEDAALLNRMAREGSPPVELTATPLGIGGRHPGELLDLYNRTHRELLS